MDRLQEIIIATSVAAMLLGWEAARRRLFHSGGTDFSGRRVWLATLAATLLTLADVGAEAIARRTFPLESLADALLWFSTTPLGAVLAIYALTRNVWPAFVLLPLAAACQIASLFFGDWFADETARRALGHTLLGLHVGLFLGGYGSLIAAAGCAIVYVVLDRRLKNLRAPSASPDEAVSLGKLDRLISVCVGIGLVLWGLGLGLGSILFGWQVALLQTNLRRAFLSDLTVMTSFLLWLYFLAFILLRRRLGWVGKRASIVVLAGFGLLLASYAAGKLQRKGVFHGFSGPQAVQRDEPR